MSEFDFEQSAPTLTFEPFANDSDSLGADTKAEIVESEQKPVVEEPVLTPQEQQMVDDFASQIDISNSGMIMQYGAGAQKKIADFSEQALGNVRNKDLGEVGDLLADVVKQLKGFDIEEEQKGGILGFFKKSGQNLNNMKVKYQKAEVSVNGICKTLEGHQIQLLKDVAMLDKMYELNKTYFKELSMYILAGKQKLEQVKNVELPAMIEKSQRSGLPEDAQAVNDMNGLINRFEKKIYDLELTRTISIQMAPQIRLVQNNDTLMAEKIQSTLVNTIPLWKSQMALALGVNHATQAARAQREVTDMTNQLLKKNAETLKMATVETAKESERGIVDLETLKYTHESLLTTLDEVVKIQDEGRIKRQEAEQELHRLESELKNKLLQMK